LIDNFYYVVYKMSFLYYISKIPIVSPIIFNRLPNYPIFSSNMVKFVANFSVKYNKNFSPYKLKIYGNYYNFDRAVLVEH